MKRTCKKVNYKSNVAYNSIFHECRFKIEEDIEDTLGLKIPDYVGIFLTSNDESLPVFAPVGSCEKVISRKTSSSGNQSGARIVLTRDNHGHRATGLGGIGATKCEAIDIVAGSLSCAKTLKDGDTQSRASFAEDGARIYLTERGDVNAYFATAKSDSARVYASSKFKSGIGIKSDHTLLIGRERVRILAGPSKYSDGERLVTGKEPEDSKIEIGGTSSEVHHRAVLGENLIQYLKLVNETLTTLNTKIQDLDLDITNFKLAFAMHSHQGVGTGAVVTFPDSIIAVPTYLDDVPKTLNKISESIKDEYNQVIKELKAFGMPEVGT